jgi:hypothetical protein
MLLIRQFFWRQVSVGIAKVLTITLLVTSNKDMFDKPLQWAAEG